MAAPTGIRDLMTEYAPGGEIDPTLRALLDRADFDQWAEKVQDARGCAKPVRLYGSAKLVDSTGLVLDEVTGSRFVPCKNRRATVCPSCSAHYGHDTFHLVRAGMVGGKGVPDTVAGHTQVLATLTAPSFGPVHSRPVRGGRARRCRCGVLHAEHDARLGAPLDPDGYDYVGSVLWQAHAGELWRRFTIAVARHLARRLGIPASRLRRMLRLSYAKVAEYQRRGLVHFHAVVRLDGPDGPEGAPPPGLDADVLADVIRSAAASVTVTTPDAPGVGSRDLGWGAQVDVEPITRACDNATEDGWNEHGTAGYVAKYATKGTGLTAGADHPLRSAEHIDLIGAPDHVKALMRTAWELGGLEELAELRLRKWAHMLGFRGHFLTKSRRYSTTFTAIRRTRAEYRLDQQRAALGLDDDTQVVMVNDWTMTGIGFRHPAERALAALYAEIHLACVRLDGQPADDDRPPGEGP